MKKIKKPSEAPGKLSVDIALALIIVALYMALPAILCRNTFCGDDSYAYWNAVDHYSNQWIAPGPIGMPAVIMMQGASYFVGSIWGIRLVAAVLSGLFFILLARAIFELFGNYWASALFSFITVFSFWWVQMATNLYKNELGLVALLVFFYCAIKFAKKSSFTWTVASLVSFFAACICHASLAIFMVFSIGIYAIAMGSVKRNVGYLVFGVAILAELFLIPQLGIIFQLTAQNASLDMKIYEILGNNAVSSLKLVYAITIPLFLIGILAVGWKNPISVLLLSFVAGALILGATGITTVDWGWRFLLDGMWAVMIGFYGGLIFCFRKIKGVEETSKNALPLGIFIFFFIFGIAIFLLLSYLSLTQITRMGPLYTMEEINILSSAIEKYHPAEIYVQSYASGLNWALIRSGYNRTISVGGCAANASSVDNVWLVRKLPTKNITFASETDRQVFENYIQEQYKYGQLYQEGPFEFIRCGK